MAGKQEVADSLSVIQEIVYVNNKDAINTRKPITHSSQSKENLIEANNKKYFLYPPQSP